MHAMRHSNDNESRRSQARRTLVENLIAAVWVTALVVGGYWLLIAFVENQREQECFARGYRSCVEREIPR
jgi:hypothetical protein